MSERDYFVYTRTIFGHEVISRNASVKLTCQIRQFALEELGEGKIAQVHDGLLAEVWQTSNPKEPCLTIYPDGRIHGTNIRPDSELGRVIYSLTQIE